MSASISTPFTLRWGFVSTGGICERFLKDILLDPKGRDVADVQHILAGVASRSLEKAEAFIKDHAPESMKTKAFGSYEELFKSPEVDVVYIGTPHPQHFRNVMDALAAGKHVLCEKPAFITTQQAKDVFQLAKQKNLFFMEAVWTRFQPIIEPAQKVVFGGEIGSIRRVDSRFDKDFGNLPLEHRMLNPALAGGGLFDLGPYAQLWATLFAFQHPANNGAAPEDIKASMIWDKRTGVDSSATWVLIYPTLGVQATVSCSLNTPTTPDSIVVTGTKGTLTMHGASPYPSSFTVRLFDSPDKPRTEEHLIKQGRGMHWQADAVARAIRNGEIEEPRMSWRETLLQQEIFDAVVKSGGYKIEKVEGL